MVYGIGWSTDTLHGASRKSIYDKIETLFRTLSLPSDVVRHSNDAEQSNFSPGFALMKEVITKNTYESFRVSFQMKTSIADVEVAGAVFVNDVQKSSEFTTILDTYTEFSYDVSNIKYNDKIQIYGRRVGSGATCFINNMKIKFDNFQNNDP